MVIGQIDALASFSSIEIGSGRTELNTFHHGGVGFYRGAMGSGFRSCTDASCHSNPCLPYVASYTEGFEGDDYVVDIACSFAGHVFHETRFRWSPSDPALAYDCAYRAPRGSVEQIYIGTGGRAAAFSIDGQSYDTCAFMVVDGTGRYSADWH